MALDKKNDEDAAANFIVASLSSRKFLATFSYREVLTAITLSFCLVAVIETLDYYANERFIQNWASVIRWLELY